MSIITKLFLLLLASVYIYSQFFFVRDFDRIYNNMRSLEGSGILTFIHVIIIILFSPGILIGAFSIIAVFSNRFNKIGWNAQLVIVFVLTVFFVANQFVSFIFGGFLYILLAWQILIAFLLFILFKRFSLIFW